MRKMYSFMAVVCCVFMLSTSAFAAGNTPNGVKLLSSFDVPSAASDGAKLKISMYEDNGKKVYGINGAQTPSQKRKAYEILNSYMQSGSVATTNVNVTSYNTDFYGNEYSSNAGSAQGYTWGYYRAGNIAASTSNVDKSWGGSSAGWFGTGTATSIVLKQKASINVVNASATLNISWPPGLSVTATFSSSTATWQSGTYSGNGSFGAQHDLVEFNIDDIHYGNVTSAVFNDSSDVLVSGYTWKPTQYVRFSNAL
jgi:hypothetical protein